MSDDFARQERDALCDALLAAGPHAPTRCEGWDAEDLAAHLWVREQDPLALPGMFLGPLAGLTDARMERVLDRWSFAELVERYRRGPHGLSAFRVPGVEARANLVECFVHCEDVRRGAGPVKPRALSPRLEDRLWASLSGIAKPLSHSLPVGVRLERAVAPGSHATGVSVLAKAGTPIVTVVGAPSELVLWTFGRRSAAEVELVGTDDAIAALIRA